MYIQAYKIGSSFVETSPSSLLDKIHLAVTLQPLSS